MTQALYRKWRPQTFDEVVGQEHVLQTLRNAIGANRIAHAYLFSGPRGTGKTTMARLLAKAVNCTNPDLAARPDNTCPICAAITDGRMLDLIELDAASNRGIDEIRDLRDKINFSPGQSRYKVYIIDEVHMLTEPAFNALLKTLEEPPPHAIFILATTDPQKVPATIVSRCQPFAFRRLTVNEIVARLQELVEAEGLTAEPEALTLIARQATGALRDAVSLLDQLAAGDSGITTERAQSALGAGSVHWVSELVDAVCQADVAAGLNTLNRAMDEGADARQFARQVVEHLRSLLLIKLGDAALVDLPAEQRSAYNTQAAQIETDRLTRSIKLFNQAALDLRGGWQPQLPLELALVESLQQPVATAPTPTTAAPAHRTTPVTPPAARNPQSAPANPVERKVEAAPKGEKIQSAPAPTSPPIDPPAPVAEASPSGEVSSLTLEQVHAQWPEILNEVKTRSLPTQALLRSCKLLGVEGMTVTLGWPSNTLKDKVESSKSRD
ncbi:MAG TPA: DNA polymerase III subunit gamma/tau, partial [Anaerolineae bacterium]